MTGSDILALLPLLITGYMAVLLSVIVPFWRNHTAIFTLTLLTLAAALGTVYISLSYAPRAVTPLIQIDSFSLYFIALIIVSSMLVALLARDYLPAHEKRVEPFYLLLLTATLGMEGIAASAHFLSFFLALEVTSVSLYGLIGYTRRYKPSLEASIKYLIMAATSSAFLLFGIALIYSAYGTMDFRELSLLISSGGLPVSTYFGMAMALVAFAFKLAIVPFHMWSPDVYQGAPAPITAFIATASKGSVLALLLRLVVIGNLQNQHTTVLIITVLAIATMFVGNFLALLQRNVKRLLAYSSIAQIGYMLIPLLAGAMSGASSIAFYLTSYFATTIAAFGVVSILSRTRAMGDTQDIDEYRGLVYKRPAMAVIMSLALLSLTGIPLTSGFFAKFYIFTAAAGSGLWTLLIIGAINSGISAFYYLRLLVAMFVRFEGSMELADLPPVKPASAIALAIASAIIIFFGVYPSPLVKLVEAAMQSVVF